MDVFLVIDVAHTINPRTRPMVRFVSFRFVSFRFDSDSAAANKMKMKME